MIADNDRNPGSGAIHTVSSLTAGIKQVLENRFPIVWVEGEVSNFRRPGSGHCYFTLKDDRARINAVMFAGQNRLLKFALEDGLRVVGLGRVTVYEPRGDYQIIFEHMMPKGAGDLQAAFEQLKKELSARGWFDEEHKQPLPFLPGTVGIISSATGAVVHDMINVITRRFPNIHIQIIPVSVQGGKAAPEVAAAVALANQRAEADVLVVARGGGSLEDLSPFNTEQVARAIFESRIPVVSAVGHETDFTICDFVADLRAPTPSAAAELIVPVQKELTMVVDRLRRRLLNALKKIMQTLGDRLDELSRRLIDPKRKIQDARLRLDDYCQRLARALARDIKEKKARLQWQHQKLTAGLPDRFIAGPARAVNEAADQLIRSTTLYYIRDNVQRLEGIRRRLSALNPKAVLARGYSITRLLPENRIVRSTGQIHSGDTLEIMVTDGIFYSTVTPAGEKTDEQ